MLHLLAGLKHRLRVVHFDQFSHVEERRKVAHSGGLLHVVGHDGNRVVLLQVVDKLFDLGRRYRIECARRTTISKKGNAFLRHAVFMPALAAVRCNPQMKELYQRLTAKGKNKKLALIAVARKLLLLIYALWKNNTIYSPDY
jgi:hypothetical protein